MKHEVIECSRKVFGIKPENKIDVEQTIHMKSIVKLKQSKESIKKRISI